MRLSEGNAMGTNLRHHYLRGESRRIWHYIQITTIGCHWIMRAIGNSICLIEASISPVKPAVSFQPSSKQHSPSQEKTHTHPFAISAHT